MVSPKWWHAAGLGYSKVLVGRYHLNGGTLLDSTIVIKVLVGWCHLNGGMLLGSAIVRSWLGGVT